MSVDEYTALLRLGEKYGWFILLIVLLSMNAGRITRGVSDVVARLVPAYAKYREHRWQVENRHWEAAQQERTDTISALTNMLSQYRQELNEAQTERRTAQDRFIDLLERYERDNAGFVSVLRDMSNVLCSMNDKLSRLEI